MNKQSGTPKSLLEACVNAVEACATITNTEEKARIVEAHIRDYLAQKFTVSIMRDPSVGKLWTKITGSELK